MLNLLLIFICLRPFISSNAFPYLNLFYSASFLIFLFIWAIAKGASIKNAQSLKRPLLLLCLALLISTVFSINKIHSTIELYKYISGLLVFLIASSLAYKDKIRVIQVIIISGFIISLLAIYQYFFGFNHILEYLSKNEIYLSSDAMDNILRRRPFFPFVTSNILSGYLIMVIPLLFIEKKLIWLILPFSFALLLTKSLGALLSLFLTLGLYFFLQNRPGKKKFIFALGFLIIMGLVLIARLTNPNQHLRPAFSTINRLNYWQDTLKIINAKPLTGVGIGNFNAIRSRYAHNSYLQFLAETGILGIISLLWLIITILKSSLKSIRNYPNNRLFALLFISSNTFLMHNFIEFSFFLPEVAFIWWVITGLSSG